MGNAGRVLMIPKGEYNAATTYEMLDFVYYNGRSYVCKQTSTGNVPTNTTYWQALTGDASAEIQALTNYDANTGVKNILPPNFNGSTTGSGITFTDNKNGTITADGTATTESKFYISVAADNFKLPAGNYKFYKGISNAGVSFAIGAYNGTTWVKNIVATSADMAEGTIDYDGYDRLAISYTIANGTSLTDALIKPMYCDASITDPTYQPYAKTNVELTKNTQMFSTEIVLTGWAENTKALLFRVGNVVWFMNTAGIVDMANGNAGSVGTIPAGFRPITSQYIAIWSRGSASDNNIRFIITKSTGDISAYNYGSAISSNSNGAFSLMWLTNDDYPS